MCIAAIKKDMLKVVAICRRRRKSERISASGLIPATDKNLNREARRRAGIYTRGIPLPPAPFPHPSPRRALNREMNASYDYEEHSNMHVCKVRTRVRVKKKKKRDRRKRKKRYAVARSQRRI